MSDKPFSDLDEGQKLLPLGYVFVTSCMFAILNLLVRPFHLFHLADLIEPFLHSWEFFDIQAGRLLPLHNPGIKLRVRGAKAFR